uniref:HMG box domain-containing protein n=1 Tax=Plectus sambesii TaxID=2011161 RepID=A0A914UMA8_9BILA
MPKAEKSSVGKKRAATKKDPNAPKRGQSAYMLWLNENRARLTKPGMGVTDVAKAAGAEWRLLTDKTKWEGMAAADKKRYEKDMVSFKAGDFVAPVKKTAAKASEPVQKKRAKKEEKKDDDDEDDDNDDEGASGSPASDGGDESDDD